MTETSRSSSSQDSNDQEIIDLFFARYYEFAQENILTPLADHYRKAHYPLSKLAPENVFLGGCFTVGYNIRHAESSLKVLRKIPPVPHSVDILKIMRSDNEY